MYAHTWQACACTEGIRMSATHIPHLSGSFRSAVILHFAYTSLSYTHTGWFSFLLCKLPILCPLCYPVLAKSTAIQALQSTTRPVQFSHTRAVGEICANPLYCCAQAYPAMHCVFSYTYWYKGEEIEYCFHVFFVNSSHLLFSIEDGNFVYYINGHIPLK